MENTIEYVPKKEAYKNGYYLWKPTWLSYDDRPKRISSLLFTILSLFPFYTINHFNGYLVRKNKHFSEKDLIDFIYNPYEKTDSILKEEFNF